MDWGKLLGSGEFLLPDFDPEKQTHSKEKAPRQNFRPSHRMVEEGPLDTM